MSFHKFTRLLRIPAALRARQFANAVSIPVLKSPLFKTLGLSFLMVALPSAAVCGPEFTVEPTTKLQFQETLQGLKLLGVGVRYKWGLVKVYAVGFYADKEGLKPGASLFQDLLDSPKKKAIVIKMARNIDSQKLVDALEEAFKPRLSMPGRSDANFPLLRKMVTEVAGGSCNTGDEFVFECTGASSIVVRAIKDGKTFESKDPFVDRDICFALFDTYLGAAIPEVSPTLKKSIGDRIV